jgi:hypothetical protein
MSRSGEKPSLPLSRKAALAVGTTVVGAAALWSLFSPPIEQNDPDAARSVQSVGNIPAKSGSHVADTPADHIAVLLQKKVRHGIPIPYDAKHGVQWQAQGPDGEMISETTIIPLEYDPDSDPRNGNELYFRLTGNGLRTIRVRRIGGSINLVPQEWEPQHPQVTATTHQGVVSVSKLTHIPDTTIGLSDGSRELVAVGQTSATP